MNKTYVVNFASYIYVDASSKKEAADKVLDIINTAYNQGNEDAYFPSVEFLAIYPADDSPIKISFKGDKSAR